LLLRFVQKLGERGVQLVGQRSVRRFLVIDARQKRFVSFGESLERGENIGIRCRGMRGGKFRDAESYSRKHILMRVDDVLRNFDVEERRVRRKLALVLILIAMRGNQVRTIRGTVNGNFALPAAANGADFLALGGTESFGFAFFTDRTNHGGSRPDERKLAEYSRDD